MLKPGGAPLYPLPPEYEDTAGGIEALARLVWFCTHRGRYGPKRGRPRTVLTDEMQRARMRYGSH